MNQPRECTDESIVSGILSDDRKALNTAIRCLYDRHTALLKDYVRRNNGSSQDADDVIQVVVLNFIKAVRSGQYHAQPGVGVGAFLNTICKRHWLNALSQRERITLRETEYYQTGDSASDGVDGLLEQQEEMEQHLRQFDKLGERCKQILTAQRRDGLSMKEIAELMGFENERVAINEKFKCIQKLKNLLKS